LKSRKKFDIDNATAGGAGFELPDEPAGLGAGGEEGMASGEVCAAGTAAIPN